MKPFYSIAYSLREEYVTLELFRKSYFAGTRGDPSYHLEMVARAIESKIPDYEPPVPNEDALTRAAEHAEIIKFNDDQKANGFPYLAGVLALKWWTVCEALFDDLLLQWLHLRENWARFPAVAKLEGRLVEFALASAGKQAELLADHLRLEIRATLKQGIGRFEEPFNAVGLGGSINDDVRKVMFEFSHIRNVLAHRGGLVDGILVKHCPWLNADEGKPIKITPRQLHLYSFSALWYMSELLMRIERFLGEPVNPGLVKSNAVLETIFTHDIGRTK